MKVLTFSRYFPKGHPKEGQLTNFVEKIWSATGINANVLGVLPMEEERFMQGGFDDNPKYHTIRAGNNWKPGHQFSARVWSGAPYGSKQIEFAQLEVKKTWDFSIRILDQRYEGVFLNDSLMGVFDKYNIILQKIAANDGLTVEDFIAWFSMHPNKKEQEFYGQIITWNSDINY